MREGKRQHNSDLILINKFLTPKLFKYVPWIKLTKFVTVAFF